jgi:cupin fold WbuC family metalloprotein
MPQPIEESPEVYYVGAPLPSVSAEDVAFLKERASVSRRRRCRLCLHASPAALHHEMLIVHHYDAYVRPARHYTRSESLIVIEGEALALTFDDAGNIATSYLLGPPGSGHKFSYYMPEGIWHGMVILSEWFVFVETSAGPFDSSLTVFPSWAPDGFDIASTETYMRALEAASRAS